MQHRTVHAIAVEMGMSNHAVETALRRHGLTRVAHAGKRHSASQRAALVAASMGFDCMADYVARRRADGWTWQAMAAESGQPQSWLRRASGALAPGALASGALAPDAGRPAGWLRRFSFAGLAGSPGLPENRIAGARNDGGR